MNDENVFYKNFSSEEKRRIEISQDILSIFSQISDENIESSFSSLESLNIFSDDLIFEYIIRRIVMFCEMFPSNIDLYVRIAKKISLKFPKIKESFLMNSFHRYYFYIDCNESGFILYMLYSCIKEELLTAHELIEQFKELFRTKYQFHDDNVLFFIYFSPELEENDTEFYEKVKQYTEGVIQSDLLSKSIQQFYLNVYLKTLVQNGFEKLKKIRNEKHITENQLFEIIYNDDVDKLHDFLSNPERSGNEVIVHSVISPFREVANKLSLISTAAFTSSVKCFKYLLMHGSKTDEVSKTMGSLAQDTIVGGNVEIIRLAQQNRVDFEGSLSTCANYFRNDIFEWLFEMKGNNIDELTKQSPTGSTVFCQSCGVGNIELALKCIEMGVDLNAADINSSPIMQAVIGGCTEIIDMLLTFGDVSEKKQSETTLIEIENNDQNDEYNDEYEYDYDNFNFEDSRWCFFDKIKPFLCIENKLNAHNVYHSMKDASSAGQIDCLKSICNHGFTVDVSLIIRAILYSRFGTLSFLFEKVDFQNVPSNDESLIMIIQSRPINGQNKNFKIVLKKKNLLLHLIKFLVKQNDVEIVKLTFSKLSFDLEVDKNKKFLAYALNDCYETDMKLEMVDTFGFLVLYLNDEDKIDFLKNIKAKDLIVFLKTSIFKDQIIEFLVNYKNSKNIADLSLQVRKLFETLNLITQ